MALTPFAWSSLSHLQLGRYAEYFVKLELTLYGFQVFTSEVDDRGIDFVARSEDGTFYEVQVKSLRKSGYVFLRKEHCVPAPHRLLAFVLFRDNEEPRAYLIPTTVWLTPSGPFVSRDYGEGKKSAPEWGLTVSDKRLSELDAYRFGVTAAALRTPPTT